jgi:hypothetical protein
MFSQACSRRSTQCAALIALAAAAGIARVPTTPKISIVRDNASLETPHVSAPSLRVPAFVFVSHEVTPWLRPSHLEPVAPATARSCAEDENQNHLPVIAPEGLQSPNSISFLPERAIESPAAFFPSALTRSHQLPFAVGPPVLGKNRYVVRVVSRRAHFVRYSVRALRGKESVNAGFSPCAANHPSAQAGSSSSRFTRRPTASVRWRRQQRQISSSFHSAIFP